MGHTQLQDISVNHLEITFAKTFEETPSVSITMIDVSSSAIGLTDVSNNYFNYISVEGKNNYNFNWIAIEP